MQFKYNPLPTIYYSIIFLQQNKTSAIKDITFLQQDNISSPEEIYHNEIAGNQESVYNSNTVEENLENNSIEEYDTNDISEEYDTNDISEEYDTNDIPEEYDEESTDYLPHQPSEVAGIKSLEMTSPSSKIDFVKPNELLKVYDKISSTFNENSQNTLNEDKMDISDQNQVIRLNNVVPITTNENINHIQNASLDDIPLKQEDNDPLLNNILYLPVVNHVLKYCTIIDTKIIEHTETITKSFTRYLTVTEKICSTAIHEPAIFFSEGFDEVCKVYFHVEVDYRKDLVKQKIIDFDKGISYEIKYNTKSKLALVKTNDLNDKSKDDKRKHKRYRKKKRKYNKKNKKICSHGKTKRKKYLR